MPAELQAARELAESLRFFGDTAKHHQADVVVGLDPIRRFFYQNDLRISEEVTPELHTRLRYVLQRLRIPKNSVEAFVYASPEMQANCISDGSDKCIIRFTSGLVSVLSAAEFEFIAGHELGHFLLSHTGAPREENRESLEYFMQMRAKEISADRMGLTACANLNVAVQAMMKTVSGLTEEHLRFDVGAFIAQLRNQATHADSKSSHPSMLVRCRALLWFSMEELTRENLSKLDERIQKDLHKYVDGPSLKQATETLRLWAAAQEIARDNKFTKEEQETFSKTFGPQKLNSLTGFLKNIPGSQLNETLSSRVANAEQELKKLIPSGFAKAKAEIEKWVQDRFTDS